MPAKEINQSQSIGIAIGIILFAAFQLFLYSALQVDIGSQIRGFETNKVINNPVYVLSAALFIIVLSITLVIL